MSDTDEPTAIPEEAMEPSASFEVVKETYDPPAASWESIKASENGGSDDTPQPSVDYEKKSIG